MGVDDISIGCEWLDLRLAAVIEDFIVNYFAQMGVPGSHDVRMLILGAS